MVCPPHCSWIRAELHKLTCPGSRELDRSSLRPTSYQHPNRLALNNQLGFLIYPYTLYNPYLEKRPGLPLYTPLHPYLEKRPGLPLYTPLRPPSTAKTSVSALSHTTIVPPSLPQISTTAASPPILIISAPLPLLVTSLSFALLRILFHLCTFL